MSITSSDVSEIVLKLMNSQKLGLRQLSRKLGYSSHSRLKDRLDGQVAWKVDDLEPLADALETTLGQLLDLLQGRRHEAASPFQTAAA